LTTGIPGRNLPIEKRLAPLTKKTGNGLFPCGSIKSTGAAYISDPPVLDPAALMMKEAGVKPEIGILIWA
jgi:hypothetical protein